LDSAQELLGIDKEVHEFIIQLTGRKAIPGFLEMAKSRLSNGVYEVLPWYEVVPEPELWLKWYDGIMNIVLITVMIVISVGVMNTILMSVFERTKELGVMLAIGTSPSQVIKLILLETLILEWVGIFFGIMAGYITVAYFNHVGISFAHLETALSQSYVSTVTYPIIKLSRVLHSSLSLMVITLLVSVYPAWKAGRLEPIKAIYHSY
jgi:putative ABC transport system permease protein